MLKEFKQFILKGNVMDLAVGVIIGAAFGKIVTSLVNDVIMPFSGLIMGNVNLTALKLVLRKAAADGTGELAVTYGQFMQTAIDFILIAFVIFLMVKAINKLRKKEAPKAVEPIKEPVPTKEELLLAEIRDLLKK